MGKKEKINKTSKLIYSNNFRTGTYEISEAEGVQRGTKIIIQLNDSSQDFSIRESIESNIQLFSSLF